MSDQEVHIDVDDLFKLIGIQTVQINTLKSQLRELMEKTSNSEKSKEESKHVNNIEEK